MSKGVSMTRPATCSVDASEHLKVLTELTDCKEKYYRLGADLRRLKLRHQEDHLRTSTKQPADLDLDSHVELQQIRRALQDSIARRDALRAEFAQYRSQAEARDRQARARLETLVDELEVAKAYVDQSKHSGDAVESLRRQLRDKSNDLASADAETEALRQDMVIERARRRDLARECEELRVTVQELKAEVAAGRRLRSNNENNEDDDDEEAKTGVLSQLIADNKRLCALLADTTEFGRFKMHVSLEGASYVDVPGGVDDNLMAWGRLVTGLQPRYSGGAGSPERNAIGEAPPSPHKTHPQRSGSGIDPAEELRWVPSEVLHVVRGFQRRHCPHVAAHHFDAWALKLHTVWHQRCLTKVRHVVDSHRKREAELRRQVQHATPYDSIVHTREIERLRHEVLALTQRLLRGGSRKGPRR